MDGPLGGRGVEIVVGVIITIVAAVAPALSATRVSPLEALQPVMTIEQSRRASRIRIGVAAVLGAIGAGLAVGSLSAGEQSLPFALGAGFAITAAVVGLAPLFVPPLLNLAGRLFGRSSRIVQLAAENAARNPSRAAATATALMLAVGLIVTLQVGAESMRRTVAGQIDASFPIDLEIMRFPAQIVYPESSSPLTRNFLPIIESLPNVGQKAILEGIPVELVKTDEDFQAVTALVYTDQMSTFLADTASGLPDGLVWVSRGQADPNLRDGGQTTLRSLAGEVTLNVHLADEIDSSTVVVSPATASRLGVKPEVVGAWIKLADRYRLADTASALAAQVGGRDDHRRFRVRGVDRREGDLPAAADLDRAARRGGADRPGGCGEHAQPVGDRAVPRVGAAARAGSPAEGVAADAALRGAVAVRYRCGGGHRRGGLFGWLGIGR